jgi:hypothetical protein
MKMIKIFTFTIGIIKLTDLRFNNGYNKRLYSLKNYDNWKNYNVACPDTVMMSKFSFRHRKVC